MDRTCSINGEDTSACKTLVAKTEGKRTLGRPKRGWVGNMYMDIREIGRRWCGLDLSG